MKGSGSCQSWSVMFFFCAGGCLTQETLILQQRVKVSKTSGSQKGHRAMLGLMPWAVAGPHTSPSTAVMGEGVLVVFWCVWTSLVLWLMQMYMLITLVFRRAAGRGQMGAAFSGVVCPTSSCWFVCRSAETSDATGDVCT